MTEVEVQAPKVTVFRKVRRMLLLLAGIYLLFVVALMFFQRRLLYFPTQLQLPVAKQMAAREGFVPWQNKSGDVIGWKLPARGLATSSVLVVHGNAGCALDRIYFAQPIHDASDADVYLLEYPGYGSRPGFPSEQKFVEAADEAILLLTTNFPIYIVSESLGAGVAAHIAKTQPDRIRGLAFFAPYNDLVSVGQNKMPFLPVRLILKDRFDPATSLKSYRGPIKFILAERDEVIPAKFGRLLFQGYAGTKDLQIIAGAGHNEISAQSAEWWKETFKFWNKNGAPWHN